MKVTIITFCLIGAVFANPISFSAVLLSSELDSNSTESVSVSQSSENDTSELKSSEENISNSSQSSESQSVESTSEDTTSEESNSLSDEDDVSDSLAETRDDSMGSEENVRQSWVRVFASVIKILSAEDNSTEVKGHSMELNEKQPSHTSNSATFKHRDNMAQGHTDLQLVDATSDSSDTTSESTDTSDSTGETAATSESSQSASKESNETNETSEDSDSSDASKSAEDSNASDSTELTQIKDCVNGTESCESDEYFFQDIGDDAHYSVDNLMVPDDDEREFTLRR
ncbi:secretory calcium-binding phosphoprotein 1 [Notolabrus celidotus]|uniref:secretory calcium-binding phosphoprotein 1 n=1 Tax=Notolabrus celidotus TaxID=1203425 RepID=UPI00148FF3CB|nr:secretory calcium-binding phosphoprotein 1 [Notolabrus celidotus]